MVVGWLSVNLSGPSSQWSFHCYPSFSYSFQHYNTSDIKSFSNWSPLFSSSNGSASVIYQPLLQSGMNPTGAAAPTVHFLLAHVVSRMMEAALKNSFWNHFHNYCILLLTKPQWSDLWVSLCYAVRNSVIGGERKGRQLYQGKVCLICFLNLACPELEGPQ